MNAMKKNTIFEKSKSEVCGLGKKERFYHFVRSKRKKITDKNPKPSRKLLTIRQNGFFCSFFVEKKKALMNFFVSA